ncbi:MAG: hypothetical protein K1X89_09590 [Myxococcaceae bacterium]|nr:hypothetical protein [Myxococcaceae bacterium]
MSGPLQFRIAGVGLAFHGLPAADEATLARDWAPFAGHAAESDVELWCAPGPKPAHGAARTLPQLSQGRLRGEDYQALVDGRRAELSAALVREGAELTARVLLARALLARGGVVLHGVAVAGAEAALAASGPSGAGKSTLGKNARLAGLTVLADELLALVPGGAGFEVHGTPWNVGQPGAAAFRAAAVIAWGPPRVERASLEEVAAVWLKNAVVPEDSAACRQAVTRALLGVLGAGATVRLQVPDDRAAGELLAGYLG